MKVTPNNSSFSAHGGMRDIPRGAVSLQSSKTTVPAKKKASRVGLLLAVLVVCSAFSLSQYSTEITRYVDKPVRTVLMEKELEKVDEKDVRGVLARHLEDGFFSLDVHAIKTELELDPWVESATITRVWPDTLSVAIIEETAIARWGEKSLLNQHGEIFQPNSIAEEMALPHLNGPDNMQRKVMDQYQTFNQMLFSSGLRIRDITLSERGSWTVRMGNDVLVTIGRNDVVERMQRFVQLFDRYLYGQIDQIEALDLRYSNGISVRKKTVMAGAVASK